MFKRLWDWFITPRYEGRPSTAAFCLGLVLLAVILMLWIGLGLIWRPLAFLPVILVVFIGVWEIITGYDDGNS